LSEEWFARPVLFVADIGRTVRFYVDRLGFTQSWLHEHEGEAAVAQVERQGCALIFSSQWPDKAGNGRMFISLNLNAPDTATSVGLDRLRAEFENRGVEVKDGWWGYGVLVVRDPDGNELWFNYPNADPPPVQ